MRKASVALLATILLSCGGGGGGGGGSSIDSTPSISNLSFSPTSALQGDGGGTITVTGTITFTDAGGDLTTLYLTNPLGQSITAPISGIGGIKSGTIQGQVTVSTQTVGHYTFQVYVSDSLGLRSNTLSGSFDVNPTMHWTQQTLPLPSGSNVMLKRVVWANSRSLFVAVGDDIFTSPDAVTWTEQPAGLSGTLMDIIWTGSQFIAVGGDGHGGAVLTSPDGLAWTLQQVPANLISPILHGVAASSTRIVAVGSQSLPGPVPAKGLMLSSTDGVTWTEVQMPVSAALEKIVWAGSQFVAVGNLDPPAGTPVALTSPDGITWTSHDTAFNTPADIAWNGSQLVVVGAGGVITSTDGITWQQAGVGVVSAFAVAWSGQGFLACGMANCYTSTDGNQWVGGIKLPGVNPTVYGLAWGDNKWVAVGAYSLVLTSP